MRPIIINAITVVRSIELPHRVIPAFFGKGMTLQNPLDGHKYTF